MVHHNKDIDKYFWIHNAEGCSHMYLYDATCEAGTTGQRASECRPEQKDENKKPVIDSDILDRNPTLVHPKLTYEPSLPTRTSRISDREDIETIYDIH